MTITSGGVNDAAQFFYTAVGGSGGAGSAVNANAVTGADYFSEAGNLVVGNRVYAYTANTNVGTFLTNTVNADANGQYTVSLTGAGQFTVTAKNSGTVYNGAQVQFLGAAKTATLTATSGGVNAVTQQNATGELTQLSGGSPTGTAIQLTTKPGSNTVLQNAALGIQFYLTPTGAATSGDLGDVYNVTSSGAGAVFQIGANAGQTASTSISSAETNAIGTGVTNTSNFANLSEINVQTTQGATDSISVIDAAISQIDNLQATLGAFQANTLVATQNSLQTALTNTTAAQAAIQDTDFAAETAQYTQQQVLMQAGQTVLANANQIPSLVISLLQGH